MKCSSRRREPTHHAVTCAVTHDYRAFVAIELPSRESPAYPPTVRLTNVVVSGADQDTVVAEVKRAAHWARMDASKNALAVEVVGPAPCPIERVKRRWRWHFFLRAADGAALATDRSRARRAVCAISARYPARTRSRSCVNALGIRPGRLNGYAAVREIPRVIGNQPPPNRDRFLAAIAERVSPDRVQALFMFAADAAGAGGDGGRGARD